MGLSVTPEEILSRSLGDIISDEFKFLKPYKSEEPQNRKPNLKPYMGVSENWGYPILGSL